MNLESWKYPSILLLGIGVSNLGAWVYLIALNLIMLLLTQYYRKLTVLPVQN